MGDEEVISREDLDDHLERKLLPYVSSQYGHTTKIASVNLDQSMKDITETVEMGNLRSRVIQS